MLWGMTLQPGFEYTEIVDDEVRLSIATLECRPSKAHGVRPELESHVVLKTVRGEFLLCTLEKGPMPQQNLDLVLQPRERVTFSVEGTGVVHLMGYTSECPEELLQEEEPSTRILPVSEVEDPMDHRMAHPMEHHIEHPIEQQIEQQVEHRIEHRIDHPMEHRIEHPMEHPMEQQRIPKHDMEEENEEIVVKSEPTTVVVLDDTPDEIPPPQEERIAITTVDEHSTESLQRRGPPQEEKTVIATVDERQPETSQRRDNVLVADQSSMSLQQTFAYPKMGEGEGWISSEESRIQGTLPEPVSNLEGMPPFSESQTMPTGQVGIGHNVASSSYASTSQEQVAGDGSRLPVQPPATSDLWKTAASFTEAKLSPTTSSRTRDDSIDISRFLNKTVAKQFLTKKGQFVCQICHLTFSRKQQLTVHERLHWLKKSHKCRFCNHLFRYNSDLQIHERRHTGEKPYKCQCCPRAFASNSEIRQHWKSHTGEKPYKCMTCNKEFAHNSSCKRHEKLHK